MAHSRGTSPVKRQGSEDRPQAVGLRRALESSLLEDRRQRPGAVLAGLLETVEDADLPEEKGHQRIRWPTPVGDVKLAAGSQDASDLARRRALVLARQV